MGDEGGGLEKKKEKRGLNQDVRSGPCLSSWMDNSWRRGRGQRRCGWRPAKRTLSNMNIVICEKETQHERNKWHHVSWRFVEENKIKNKKLRDI